MMDQKKSKHINQITELNYKTSQPWPEKDIWHSYTNKILHKKVQNHLNELNLSNNNRVLNAGCGRTSYNTSANVIYMDIIEEYVKSFPNYLVASIEKIPLPDDFIDCIICVGSVINYADAQKTFSEFERILRPGGTLILEFERSNSAEFLFTNKYAKTVFLQKYSYNKQEHYLWMYNEKFIIHLAEYYNMRCQKKYRYHNISSLLYRFGVSEKEAAKYSKLDDFLQFFSYFIAHNEIIIFQKNSLL